MNGEGGPGEEVIIVEGGQGGPGEEVVSKGSFTSDGRGGPGKLLPKTATDWFNFLAIGSGLLVIGFISIFLTRRKRTA